MEALQKQVLEMTGALNATLAQVKALEAKIKEMEQGPAPPEAGPQPPPAPRTEYELREISQLPDRVKELQPFDGNPTHYVSWIHSVESILRDYEIVRNKPIYRAILQSIRQKIRGGADTALVSYNVFEPDWLKMKECLSLHYADKRDISTLEHQLNQLTQKNSKIDEFYATVNRQFSLIINKIRTESYSKETVDALIETYRNRALDVFVRGLNGELSRLLIVQRPKTLPEAYAMCLEMQNLSLRSTNLHPVNRNQITVPMNTMPRFEYRPHLPARPYNNFQGGKFRPWNNSSPPQPLPPRPLGPKPAEKMEVDNSMQSRAVNYMNRPSGFKMGSRSDNFRNPFKRQKLFNTFMQHHHPTSDTLTNLECAGYDGEETQESDGTIPEINFMAGASLPVSHT